MSRIGVKPITVPAGVEVTIAADNTVTVKGPRNFNKAIRWCFNYKTRRKCYNC